jgi:hypothetical protein
MLDRDAAETVATLQRNGALAGASAQAFTAALTRYAKQFLALTGGKP